MLQLAVLPCSICLCTNCVICLLQRLAFSLPILYRDLLECKLLSQLSAVHLESECLQVENTRLWEDWPERAMEGSG